MNESITLRIRSFGWIATGGLVLLILPQATRSQPPVDGTRKDAVTAAQTPNDVPVERPEQKKTAHDLSDIFNPSNALPTPEALKDQQDRGQRMVSEVQAFLQEMHDAGKPLTAICHAPWELVSVGLVRGRTPTSYHTIQDDIRNAGGERIDREVVEVGNRVTSRQPDDLPAFNRAMLALFSHNLVPGGK